MERAKSIKEIKQVFRFNDKYLEEDNENFFENIYKKDMRKLEIDIEDSEIHYDTFYITGQSGNGKSTAVHQLKRSDVITKKYDIQHIFANDLLDFQDEVTIVDVFLMLGIILVEGTKLEEKYLKELQDLKDINVGKLEKSYQNEKLDDENEKGDTYMKGDIGFLNMIKFRTSFKKEYIESEKNRTLLRKLFLPNRRELLNLINSILKEIDEREGKKLLLIIDDLEKKNLSEELFTRDKELLEKIEVLKIVMIPVNYAKSGKVYKLSLRITSNPNKADDSDKKPLYNKELLKKLVYKRIDKNFHHLLPDEDDVLGEMINMSGGNIRQLLRLIYEAASSARYESNEMITRDDVKEASQTLINLLAIGVNNRQTFLSYVDEHNQPQEDEMNKFKISIADNSIFAYFNGQPWYDVNPALKDYIKSITASKR